MNKINIIDRKSNKAYSKLEIISIKTISPVFGCYVCKYNSEKSTSDHKG